MMEGDRFQGRSGTLPGRRFAHIGDADRAVPDGGGASGVIAVDVGATKIAAALVSFPAGASPLTTCAHVVSLCDCGEAATAADAVVQAVRSVLDDIRDAVGFEGGLDAGSPKIAGIGVGARGLVDPRDGSILDDGDLLPGWKGTPIAAILQRRFAMPVAVLNDAQAHALGEARWGAGRSASSCLLVACGTGLGGGIVIDGRLLLGSHGSAGHIGHTLHPEAAGSVCSCGGLSHVESIASGSGIESMYRALPATSCEDSTAPDGAEIARRARNGEAAACTVLRRAGYALGQAIGSWVNTIDPGLVILSGSVCGAGKVWRMGLDEGFASQVLEPLADTPIVFGRLGCDAALVGAAQFLLDSLDSPVHISPAAQVRGDSPASCS
jgi:glucokinase